jgi:hypothetical protein
MRAASSQVLHYRGVGQPHPKRRCFERRSPRASRPTASAQPLLQGGPSRASFVPPRASCHPLLQGKGRPASSQWQRRCRWVPHHCHRPALPGACLMIMRPTTAGPLLTDACWQLGHCKAVAAALLAPPHPPAGVPPAGPLPPILPSRHSAIDRCISQHRWACITRGGLTQGVSALQRECRTVWDRVSHTRVRCKSVIHACCNCMYGQASCVCLVWLQRRLWLGGCGRYGVHF